MREWTEQACTQCNGDTWVEVPSYFKQGRTDGGIVYRRETCQRCKGTGEEPIEGEDNDTEN